MKRTTRTSFDWTTPAVVSLCVLGLGLIAADGFTSDPAHSDASAPTRAFADDTSFERKPPAPSLREDTPRPSSNDIAQLRKANEGLREELTELYDENKELTDENQRLVQDLKETKALLQQTRAELAESRRINVELLAELDSMIDFSTEMITKVSQIGQLEGELVVQRPANLSRRPTRGYNREAANDINDLEDQIFASVAQLNTRCQQIVTQYARQVNSETLFSESAQPVE
ncbi:MAG: hypothetical protein ACFB20_00035 [Opitutales bacterium]